MKSVTLATIFAPVLLTATAQATLITVTKTGSIPLSPTDWAIYNGTVKNISIDKFNILLGTLKKVEITYRARVSGSVGLENEDPTGKTMTGRSTVDVSLIDPKTLVNTIVALSNKITFVATAYDGLLDYAGTSGKTSVTGNGAYATDTIIYTDQLDIFKGTGTQQYGFTAESASTTTGGGNMKSSITSGVEADLTVIYTYDVVPEPATLALFALAIPALLRRRRA